MATAESPPSTETLWQLWSLRPEGKLLGCALRHLDMQDRSYIDELFSRRSFFPDELQQILDACRGSISDGATNSIDIAVALRERGQHSVGRMVLDGSLDGLELTRPYFNKLLLELARPTISQRLDLAREDLAAGSPRSIPSVLCEIEKELLPLCSPPSAEAKVRILDVDMLHRGPKVSWLVEGLLPAAGLTAVYGPPGSGKSFIALSIALAVASRRAWGEHSVQPGQVLYVAAEGSAGLSERVEAWQEHHRVADESISSMFFAVAHPIRFFQDGGRELAEALSRLQVSPVLIVIDTLSRCFVGGDENSTEDMAEFVGALDELREKFHATVLVVHHASRGAGTLRGNSALEGALDTMIRVSSQGGESPKDHKTIGARVLKQKDAADGSSFHFRLQPIDETRVVLEEISAKKFWDEKQGCDYGLLKALESQCFGEKWIAEGHWRESYPAIGERFGEAVKRLVEAGHVEYLGGGRSGSYRVVRKPEVPF